MTQSKIYYKEPVFRPPSEAHSLLIQATEGCTFNCTFCYPYMKKKFKIRKLEDIKKDIDVAKKLHGNSVQRIFLLDGNAFVMKPEMIIDIRDYAYDVHPNLERVTAYAHAKDILRKSVRELKAIRKAGFTMVYVGIETGDDSLLKEINKQVTSTAIFQAAEKLYKSGIILSGTVILGLAGKDPDKSKKHAKETAHLINKINPPENVKKWYIAALTLMLPPGTRIKKEVNEGSFEPISNLGALRELKIMVKNTSDEIQDCIFRSNHASNYLPIRGVLSKDKKKILKTINY